MMRVLIDEQLAAESVKDLLGKYDSTIAIAAILDSITEMTDPQMFFRANRKYIVSRRAILDIIVYSASKLKSV
ncbi:MAG: hypothetical protein GXO83_01715 [Chlorobi bacterium]|nr:hypothetical protein [Chlorobiota bacterium]